MLIAVVLGYWLNDDGTRNPLLDKRLELAIDFINEYKPYKVILSGGVANKKAGVAEASLMYDYLINRGVDKNLLIKEDKSNSTKENAINSVAIAKSLGVTTLAIVTTYDHYLYKRINVVKFFGEEVNDDKIRMLLYTDSTTEEEVNE